MKRYHKKKRNSALLYEFLIKHISKCLLENKKEEAQKALEISKKHFAAGSPLKDELDLFNAFTKTSVKSEISAKRIIETVCNASSKQSARKLDECKSKLIKDINYVLKNEEFYNARVSDYMVLASIQVLLNESRAKVPSLSKIDRIKLEDSIVQFLLKEQKQPTISLNQKPEYSNSVYSFIVKRFYEKYDNKLSESQKKLLIKYAKSQISGKSVELKEFLKKEVETIKNKLRLIKDESLIKDKDLMSKISECYKKVSQVSFDEIADKNILEILQFMKLVEEIES